MVLFKSVSENGSEDRTATQESPQLERVQKKGLAWLRKGATWRARAVPVLQGRTSFGQSIRRRPDGTRASGFSVRAKFQSEIKNKYDTSFAARRKKQENLERILVMKKSPRVLDPKQLPLRPAVMALLLAYTALIVPFEIAELPKMSVTAANWPVFFLNRLADLILLADIVLGFFLAVFDSRRNVWVTNQSFIIRRYLRGWFLIDLVALMPYDLLPYLMPHARVEAEGDTNATYQMLSWLMLLRLTRLTRLFKLETVFASYRNEVNWDYSLATLCKYSLYGVLFIHWLACTWWYIAEMELLYDIGEETWMTVFFDGSRSVSMLDKYIASSYWSVMTAATVGYGGPTNPKTRVEFIFNTVAMLVAAFAFGYIIGTVAAVMGTRGLRTQLMYQIMDDVSHFSDACNLPKRLRHKLEDYFKFRCTQAMDHDYHLMLLHTMSPALRSEVAAITDTQWLAQLSIFQKAPESMISRLSIAMQQILYPPLETIFNVGDPIRRLFVIKRGIIVSAGRVRMAGHAMGDEALLELYRSTYSARSMTYSEVNEIDIDTIYDILEGYPKFKKILRVYAIKKVFRSEVLAYAEAMRRLDQVEQDIRDVVRRKTMFMEKYDLADADLDELIDGDVPSVSVEYIVKSLKETMPDTEGRIAHYMVKLGRFMGRSWRRFKARRRAEVAERNGRLLTWATFMIKMAMGDPGSQLFWMNIAHRHLSNMGIETEGDVQQLFWALKESGIEVEGSALAAEIASLKESGWKSAKRVVPVVRLGLAGSNNARGLLNCGGLDLDQLSESPNPIMAVMMAIVKWNGRDVSSAINAEVVRSKSIVLEPGSPSRQHTQNSRRVSELRWTRYRMKMAANKPQTSTTSSKQPLESQPSCNALRRGSIKSVAGRDAGRRWEKLRQQQRRESAVAYLTTSSNQSNRRRISSTASASTSMRSARKMRPSTSSWRGGASVSGHWDDEVGGLGLADVAHGGSLSMLSHGQRGERAETHSARATDILMSSGGMASSAGSPSGSGGTNKYKGSRLSVKNAGGGVAGGVHPALMRAEHKQRTSKY